MTLWEMVLRLTLAFLLGGLIGFEREYKNRPAGLRTHVLVTLGSTLIMLISMYGFEGGDPARLAAQVVSGIGFLGAGTIMRDGVGVRGLTTAASIWVCGGIGLALGNGYYGGAIATTIIVLLSLVLLGFLESKVLVTKFQKFTFKCRERAGLLGDIGIVFGENNVSIVDVKINRLSEEILELSIQVKKINGSDMIRVIEALRCINGIETVDYNKNEIFKE